MKYKYFVFKISTNPIVHTRFLRDRVQSGQERLQFMGEAEILTIADAL